MKINAFYFHIKSFFNFDLPISVLGMRDDDLVTLQLVGDFSYAWEIIDCFTLDMQEGVKKDPTTLGKLRAMFLKVNYFKRLIFD